MKRGYWVVLMVAIVGLVVGCTAPSSSLSENTVTAQDNTQAQLRELEARNKEFEARIRELEARNKALSDRLSPESSTVDLINPNFPPALGGEHGWEYHQVLSADLDSDGQQEQVSVTTNAVWIPEKKEFAWDDGHPWHVYVQAADGSRTYLFSNWVQMGHLDVILDREGPGLFIVSSRGGSLAIYRATYRGPGQATTVDAFSIPLSDFATWADPLKFSR